MNKAKAFESSAEIYDLLYKDKDYEKEVEFIISQFENKNPKKKILEIGCGTGNYLQIFLKKGYDIAGIDVSNEMLEMAKKKCKCKLFLGDVRDFKINEKFDVILAMFDVLSYINSNSDFVKALQNIRNHLSKDGLFIFQVWNGLGVLYEKPETRIREVEDENIKVIRSVSPVLKAEKQVVDVIYRYLVIDKKSNKIKENEEVHSMRFFFPQEIKYFLETNGFEPIKMSDFMNINKKVDETTWNLFAVAKLK